MRRARGFTLIALMIVVVISAIPNPLSARLDADETAASSTLRIVSSAQAWIQAPARPDTAADDVGELGMFQALFGGSDGRDTIRDATRKWVHAPHGAVTC